MANPPNKQYKWALDSTFDPSVGPSGSAWHNEPNKVLPSDLRVSQGYVPSQSLDAESLNYLLNSHGDWVDWLSGSAHTLLVASSSFATTASIHSASIKQLNDLVKPIDNVSTFWGTSYGGPNFHHYRIGAIKAYVSGAHRFNHLNGGAETHGSYDTIAAMNNASARTRFIWYLDAGQELPTIGSLTGVSISCRQGAARTDPVADPMRARLYRVQNNVAVTPEFMGHVTASNVNTFQTLAIPFTPRDFEINGNSADTTRFIVVFESSFATTSPPANDIVYDLRITVSRSAI